MGFDQIPNPQKISLNLFYVKYNQKNLKYEKLYLIIFIVHYFLNYLKKQFYFY